MKIGKSAPTADPNSKFKMQKIDLKS